MKRRYFFITWKDFKKKIKQTSVSLQDWQACDWELFQISPTLLSSQTSGQSCLQSYTGAVHRWYTFGPSETGKPTWPSLRLGLFLKCLQRTRLVLDLLWSQSSPQSGNVSLTRFRPKRFLCLLRPSDFHSPSSWNVYWYKYIFISLFIFQILKDVTSEIKK